MKLRKSLFLGDVLSSRTLQMGDNAGNNRLERSMFVYKVQVVETFTPSLRTGQQIEVLSGIGGADCSFHFISGQRYLIDTWETGGALFTGLCTLTRPERSANLELETLRLLALNRKVPDVIGTVSQYIPNRFFNLFDGRDSLSYPIVPSIKVEMRPADGGQALIALTDSAGVYSFEHVRAGRYDIHPNLPNGLVIAEFGDAEASKLAVPASLATGPMCQVELVVAASGSIAGRIAGRNVSEDSIEEVRIYISNSRGRRGDLMGRVAPRDGGTFHMRYLSPGKYRLVYQLRGQPDFEYAHEIKLGEGERKTDVVIRLPQRIR